MPTVAELQVVLEAQDRASAQLRQVGQEVQRLQQRVEGAQRTTARGGGFLGGLNIGAGIAAAQGAFRALGGVAEFVGESIFALNSRLERTTATLEALTGSAQTAGEFLAIMQQEAARGFDLSQMEQAGRTLVNFAQGSSESFRDLLQLAEQLAIIDPAAGIESAAFAIREALSGDFTSLAERFEVSRVAIQRWKEEGLTNLQIVERAVASVGGSAAAVERLGRTFEGRIAVVQNFGNQLRALVGQGIFLAVSDRFGQMVDLIARHGDRLRALARDVGAVLGVVFERLVAAVSGPLRALVEFFAPGLWEDLTAGLSRVPEQVERTAEAAERAAPAARDLNRELGRLGVAAAEVQLQADRTERAFRAQLEPLERQLRLLQQSADVQRVQNALATNRATVQRLGLEREIVALQRAARGQEDPNAPGLTTRQRAIALALEERRLRVEELGLEEQRRPLTQSLEQQIAALQDQQRAALKPLEDQLALYRDQIAAIQLERQQTELLTQEAERAGERIRGLGTGVPTQEALEDSRRRGEELVKRLTKGWEDWVAANGGDTWKAINTSIQKWLDEGGRAELVKKGNQIGQAISEGIGAFIGEWVKQTFFPGGMPRVEGEFNPGASLPTVNVPISPPGRPGAAGDTQITINVGETLAGIPGFQDRFRAAFADFWRQFILAAANTEPGARESLQGSGRTP